MNIDKLNKHIKYGEFYSDFNALKKYRDDYFQLLEKMPQIMVKDKLVNFSDVFPLFSIWHHVEDDGNKSSTSAYCFIGTTTLYEDLDNSNDLIVTDVITNFVVCTRVMGYNSISIQYSLHAILFMMSKKRMCHNNQFVLDINYFKQNFRQNLIYLR